MDHSDNKPRNSSGLGDGLVLKFGCLTAQSAGYCRSVASHLGRSPATSIPRDQQPKINHTSNVSNFITTNKIWEP
jgi:hypothetical protein